MDEVTSMPEGHSLVDEAGLSRGARNRKERRREFHVARAKALPKWAGGGGGLVEPRDNITQTLHSPNDAPLKFLLGLLLLASLLLVLFLNVAGHAGKNRDDNCSRRDARPFTLPRKPMAIAFTNGRSEVWVRATLERITGRMTTTAACNARSGYAFGSFNCTSPRSAITTTADIRSTSRGSTGMTGAGVEAISGSEVYRGTILVAGNPFDVVHSAYLSVDANHRMPQPSRYLVETAVKDYQARLALWHKPNAKQHLTVREEDLTSEAAWGAVGSFLGGLASSGRIKCGLRDDEGEIPPRQESIYPQAVLEFFSPETLKYMVSVLGSDLCRLGYAGHDKANLTLPGLECSEHTRKEWESQSGQWHSRLRRQEQRFAT